jgi:hypothetical protein
MVASFFAMVLSWRPYAWRKLTAGIDPSWQAGLAAAFEHHLQWGPSLVFTFGPYGFVDNILPFYRATALLAVVYAVVVTWGLAVLVVSGLRPSWGLLAAGVAAWAVIAIADSKTGYSDLASVTTLGLALAAVNAESDVRRWLWLALLGAVAGFQLLAKVNDGALGAGMVVVAVALGPRPRPKATLAAGVPMVGVAVVGWVAAGQSLSNVLSYARGSVSVATGYSSAMQLATGRGAEDVFAVVVLVLLGVLFVVAQRHASSRGQLATFLLVTAWAWATLKEGFVRHDTHDLTFFGLMLAGLALARAAGRYAPVQAGALAVAAVLACVAAGGAPEQLHSPGASTAAFVDDLAAVVGGRGFARAQAAVRAGFLATGDALSPAALAQLKGQSVAIEPTEAAIAYAYPALDWDPEPVLQGYSAYTAYLDRLDANFLASTHAPGRVLYQAMDTIDGRDPWWDPPATLESMYCHYVELATAGRFQVLGRGGGRLGRCGRPQLLARVKTRFGGVVAVPRDPGRMVTATFAVSAPLSGNAEAVLLKPPLTYVTVWSGPSVPSRYRFIPGTAGDVHVMSVPSALGYAAPFTPPPIKKLEVSGGGWSTGRGVVTITFYAVPLQFPMSPARRPT